MRIITASRSLHTTTSINGRGVKFESHLKAVERRKWRFAKPPKVEIVPNKDITPFVYDWGQQRHNYQGFGSQKFYSRESGPNDTVPSFTDWTQGELAQEEVIDTYGTSDARLWRTRVVKEKVPLLIAPSRSQLLKSPLKPFVSRNSMETQQIEMQIRDLDKEDNDYYNQLKTAIQQEQFNMAESRHGDIKVGHDNELKNK